MILLVIGGSGNGKSAYAEERIAKIRDEKQLPVYYIATMQVHGKEEEKIVERHHKLREGKGFITIEQERDICDCPAKMSGRPLALLECASNLVANEMFTAEGIRNEDEVVEKIGREIKLLAKGCEDLVIVTGNIFEDKTDYDETTMGYIRALGRVNELMAAMADEVVEMVVGIPVNLK